MAKEPPTASETLRVIKEAGGNIAEAARLMHVSRSTMQARADRAGWKREEASPPNERRFTVEQDGESCRVWSVDDAVRTPKDALAKAEIDTAVWEIERQVINSWPCAAKTDDGRFIKTNLWQVKLWLRRRVSSTISDAFAALAERVAQHAPHYPKRPKVAKPNRGILAEICLFDHHFGKLAWGQETGNCYDLKVAEQVFKRAAENLVADMAGFRIEKFLIPFGHDFLHIDGIAPTTTSGTRMDTDSRYPKIFEAGSMAMVWLIDYLMSIAPVDVAWVPGNHDRNSSYAVAQFLRAWYRNASEVSVDVGPKVRKFYRYGTNLLGMAHGEVPGGKPIKQEDLPLLMADEVPELWAQTTHHEWHLGHFHRAGEMKFVSTKSRGRVRVRILPSLSGTDAWHFENGFISDQIAEAYLWDEADGYVGHFSTRVRPEVHQ